MFGREKVAAIVAEFVGTFTLASVVLAMIGRTTFPFFSALAAGLTVVGLTLAFGAVSKGYYNPALTVAAWTVRQLDTARALVFIAAQMLGGVVAWTLNEYLLGQTLKNIANTGTDWRLFTAEAVGGFVLALIVASAVHQAYTGLKYAVTIGLGFTLGILLASFAGNGLVNPAVAVGVQSWSLVYAAAPVLGALFGMNLYATLFVPKAAKKTRSAVVKTAKVVAKKTVAKKKTSKKRK